MTALFTEKQRQLLGRVIFGWFVVALLWRWSDSAMISQLEQPVLGNVYKDLTFWLFELARIPAFVTGQYAVALLLDLVVTTAALLAFLQPSKVVYARIYCLAILFYFVIFTTYANYHYRPIIGLLVAGLPFAFRSMPRFGTFVQVLRYYVLFLYASAGLYKVMRGSWLNVDQMTMIIEKTQLDLLLTQPDNWHSLFYTWLLNNEWASWSLFVLATVLEVSFIIGFFTKRWDLGLFCTAISLHIGFYFTMGFFAFELIVLDLLLLPWNRMYTKGQLPITSPALSGL
ncbi:MAG: hypothetical protein IPO87_06110 [Flavobacteriales bacterium]|nr:hypothetical protein [Flavobacteriales bacterium]